MLQPTRMAQVETQMVVAHVQAHALLKLREKVHVTWLWVPIIYSVKFGEMIGAGAPQCSSADPNAARGHASDADNTIPCCTQPH